MNAFVPTIGRVATPTARASATGAVSARASRFVGRYFTASRSVMCAPMKPTSMQMDDEEPMDMDRGMSDEPQELEEAKLFVGNLSWGSTDESLGEAFSEFGEVIDSK